MSKKTESLFKDAFSEMSEIHSWKEPETFGFEIEKVKIDKRSKTADVNGRTMYYMVGTAHYPPDDLQQREIIYPFSAMDTQLRKLFGEGPEMSDHDDEDHVVPQAVGKNILIKYEGKKPNPTKGRPDFHSCYITELK